ncbi:MAG: allantoate amidohydrolase [Gammaproteobacteria bacterium]
MARLEEFARYSEEDQRLTRTYLTPVQRAAGEQLIAWMKEAGMRAGFDGVGNVIGRYEGVQPGLPALMIGSHYDTVRNAGKYDGALGILSAIACVEALHRAGERLPFAIEVAGFAEEEGVRFGATLIGSRAVAGNFDYGVLAKTDAAGVSVAAALRDFGLDPDAIGAVARKRGEVLAYLEIHIEQGPVLLSEGLALGIVTAIAGASRFQIRIEGQAGHAGTVPMRLRHDAAAAAAEALLFVERRCRSDERLVGTVGKLQVPNGAVNVIPGVAEFSLDLRSGDDAARRAALTEVLAEFDAIGARRGVTFNIVRTHDAGACTCAPWLMEQLAQSLRGLGIPERRLPSGAGHDAMALAALTDVAMLFVRCGNDGVSHHPDETMTVADAELSTLALFDFIRRFRPPQA